jgi:hypothetical protein
MSRGFEILVWRSPLSLFRARTRHTNFIRLIGPLRLDLYINSGEGCTALDLALQFGHEGVVEILEVREAVEQDKSERVELNQEAEGLG